MNDPLILQLITKYSTIFIKEIVQMFNELDSNKSIQQVIQQIQINLIPKIKQMILNRQNELKQHKQELQKQIEIYKTIKIQKDEFSQQALDGLDQFYNILSNKNIQPFIIKNIQYMLDSLIGFCLELYHVMYPIISDKSYEENEFISGFDNILKDVIDPDMSYQQIFQSILGQSWYKYVQYEHKTDIFNNKINFKNVSIKAKHEMVKKAEIQLMIKWYTIFFDKYYNSFISIGEKFLPKSITKWLPVSTDLLFGNSLIIDLLYNYFHYDLFKLTNICCSKEFLKLLMIAKKIFKTQ